MSVNSCHKFQKVLRFISSTSVGASHYSIDTRGCIIACSLSEEEEEEASILSISEMQCHLPSRAPVCDLTGKVYSAC